LNFNLYHKNLKLNYAIYNNGIYFSDGVLYRNEEIKILKMKTGFDYLTIHNAKKIFTGEVVG